MAKSMMPPLPLAVERQLDAAQGWLGLGDPLSAREELDQIPTELKNHPRVLLGYSEYFAATKRWEECSAYANAVVQMAPSDVEGWIKRSYALHELKRTRAAFDLLLPAAEKFPDVWLVPYNLACYCAQLGRLEEAEKWFLRAMAIDAENVKHAAQDDPDLIPLKESGRGQA
jgi:tetratricopeptide (TPR) repeat protein